jgi:hypothetical protein
LDKLKKKYMALVNCGNEDYGQFMFRELENIVKLLPEDAVKGFKLNFTFCAPGINDFKFHSG